MKTRSRQHGMRRIKTICHLDPPQRVELERLSQRTGAPMSEIIRRAVAAYLAAQESR